MEVYPTPFDWDQDCILVNDIAACIVLGLPADLCEIYIRHTHSIVTAIVVIEKKKIAPLKVRAATGQFTTNILDIMHAIIFYAEAHPTAVNGFGQYCFAFVEP